LLTAFHASRTDVVAVLVAVSPVGRDQAACAGAGLARAPVSQGEQDGEHRRHGVPDEGRTHT